jgi:hypothetical protein
MYVSRWLRIPELQVSETESYLWGEGKLSDITRDGTCKQPHDLYVVAHEQYLVQASLHSSYMNIFLSTRIRFSSMHGHALFCVGLG